MDLFAFAATQTVKSVPKEEPAPVKVAVPVHDEVKAAPAPQDNANYTMTELVTLTTKRGRIEKNLDAIRELKKEGCKFKAKLVQFTGWGGLTDVFMEDRPDYQTLKDLLTPEEYESASNSMLDSYYTPAELIKFMWKIAQNELGILSGKVAELGCGIGNFIGLAPKQSQYKFTGVEIDRISGSIAKELYPQADIRIESLEKVNLPANFDLVIGNVPFGQTAPYDKNYKGAWNLHNYCISRALDCLKDKGHAVLLTSSSTMDRGGSMEQILQGRAGLVKAIRLPNNTFAGTEVVADILILQKGIAEEESSHLEKIETADNTGTAEINAYFASHPANIWGTLSNTGKMYGKTGTMTVLPGEKSVERHIREYQFKPAEKPGKEMNLFGEIEQPQNEVKSFAGWTDVPEEADAPRGSREYSIFTTEQALYQVIDGRGVRMKDKKGENLTSKEIQKITSFVRIKEQLDKLIQAQLDDKTEEQEVEDFRHELKRLYQLHLSKYGNLSNGLIHRNCVEDPEYLKVAAIENCRKVTETNKAGIKITKKIYEPGDILSKRTQWPWHEPTHADSVVEAGLISHAYRNRIAIGYISDITGKGPEKVRTELLSSGEYFYNPENMEIELKSKYLSGNIKNKLRIAEEQHMDVNAVALREVLPKPLTIEDIDFSMGAFWLPASLIEKWMAKDLNCKATVKYNTEEDFWEIDCDWNERQLLNQYDVNQLDTIGLLEKILNLKDPIIKDRVWDPERLDYIEVVNKEATLTARQYKNEVMSRFHDFIMDDPELSQIVEEVYNGVFNNHVLQQYDLPQFEVYPGAAEIINGKVFHLRDHQKRAVTRCIQGNTLLAHAVGAGKTAIMVTAAMELIRLKLATKTMIVVQNATLQQFAEFAPKLYPTANILIANKKDLAKDNRKRFLGRIATGKWDIIIIAQSSFNMIEDNPDLIRAKYEEELEQMIRSSEARNVAESYSRKQRKDEEKAKRALQHKIDKMADRHALEDIVYFDELGIDAIFIDEAHEYKRNFFITKMRRVKGLDNGASQKAFSLNLKLNQIREKTGGRNIYFATGTPVTNTLAELWNMVRYVSPETLKAFHVDTFDRFASTFAQSETALEIDAAGRFKMVTRFAKYTNVVELSRMFRTCADVILSEDLKDIPRPPIKGGHPAQVNLKRTGLVSDFMHYLSDTYSWFEQLSGEDKKEWTHIPICIYGLSRKSTIDMRLIAEKAPDDPESKLNVCVRNVLAKYREYDSIKGAQIIFSDLHKLTVENIVRFDVFQEIKKKLVAGGIPENEIAIVNDYKTDKQRQDCFDLVNSGEIRVIMGSTKKLGTGVNIQERLAVAHHLDAPFRPADMEQRDGRIIRQGNMLSEVEIIRYGMEETLDAGMYQILTRKQKFINDGMMGRRKNMEEINDASVDYATFSANISGNPLLQQKVKIETRLRELKSLEMQYRKSIRRNADTKAMLEKNIPVITHDIEVMRELAAASFNTEYPQIELNGNPLEGTTEYKLKQLANHLLQKGLYPAITRAKSEFETTEIDLGYARINGIELSMKAVCVVADWHVNEESACVEYRLQAANFHNDRIKVTGQITTASGLLTSVKTVLKNLAEAADEESRKLEVDKKRLEQLSAGTVEAFKYGDERNTLQAELDKIMFELDSKDMLRENKEIKFKPRLADYIDLGVEVIADKPEAVSEDEPENEDQLDKTA